MKRKRKKSGVQKCNSCLKFDSDKKKENKNCPYEDVSFDDIICEKFVSKEDYKEINSKTIKIDDKTSVNIIMYTWQDTEPKIKMNVYKVGQKGKEYTQTNTWPKIDLTKSIKLIVAIRKMIKAYED